MRIVAKRTLTAYAEQHPDAAPALERWYNTTLQAEWHSFADIRNTFATVSQVGNQRYVFNIKGNDYRLVVLVLMTPQTVYIRFVGTHAQYDQIKDIQHI